MALRTEVGRVPSGRLSRRRRTCTSRVATHSRSSGTFPELIEPLQAALPERCIVDGEVVIATDHGLDFDALQQRIHPAASRVNMLSQQTPASVVLFDLLALDDDDLRERPLDGAAHRPAQGGGEQPRPSA